MTADLAATMTAVYHEDGWRSASLGTRSGGGSTLEATATLRAQLPALCRALRVISLLDAPCGDGHWIAGVDLGEVVYFGVDLVREALLATHDAFRAAGKQEIGFAYLWERDARRDDLPRCDLVLCKDLLLHLSFADGLAVLRNLRRTEARYLLASHRPDLATQADHESGQGWRHLNLTLPPFSLGVPIALLGDPGAHLGLWSFG